jgi:hypothetical protein
MEPRREKPARMVIEIEFGRVLPISVRFAGRWPFLDR